jgi:hypothetical protein
MLLGAVPFRSRQPRRDRREGAPIRLARNAFCLDGMAQRRPGTKFADMKDVKRRRSSGPAAVGQAGGLRAMW